MLFRSQRVDRIPVVVTDPVGPLTHLIDADDPEFGWQNFLKKYREPVIRPVEVKTGWSISIPFIGDTRIVSWMPDEQEAPQIISDVLESIRAVFIEKAPASLSRALAEVIGSIRRALCKRNWRNFFHPGLPVLAVPVQCRHFTM